MTQRFGSIVIGMDTFPTDRDLAALYHAAWGASGTGRFQRMLRTCLLHVTAHDGNRLIGFAKVATDGDTHAFLLDPIVHPEYRRAGLGTSLVEGAVNEARARGAKFLHVDFEPALIPFYEKCGFTPTQAGLMRL